MSGDTAVYCLRPVCLVILFWLLSTKKKGELSPVVESFRLPIRRLDVLPTAIEWIVVALLGKERWPKPSRQEANFTFSTCRHQNQIKNPALQGYFFALNNIIYSFSADRRKCFGVQRRGADQWLLTPALELWVLPIAS